MKHLVFFVSLLISISTLAQRGISKSEFKALEADLIKWRRDFHKHPELSNREFKTAEKIATHLRSLGLEVETGIAKTGVVAILKGKREGKVLALRADIDALPVIERNNLAFKSLVSTTYLGKEVGVMHACGHDAHIAILMGVASILSKHRNAFNGSIKFIFQPAEEGAPPGEEGGAALMVKEGVLQKPRVDAIFGLHVNSASAVGTIKYKPGAAMAAVNRFEIHVKGKQTHGSQPWSGVDPILISAKIIDGLQTIISREANLTNEAAVITIGKITSGVRSNIIPETAEMVGTLRTLDLGMKEHIQQRMTEMVIGLGNSYGGKATIEFSKGYPITYNDPQLVAQMLPSLQKVAGKDNVQLHKATTGAEDFSFFQEKVPGFYFFIGVRSLKNTTTYPHHTPDFKIDESGLLLGVKAFTQLTIDFLNK